MALIVAGGLALGACTTTGASSYANSQLKADLATEQTGSVQAANSVGTGGPPLALADPASQDNLGEAGQPAAIAAGKSKLAANGPQSRDRRIELASLAAEDSMAAAATQAATQARLAYAADPAERAAEQRIAALFPKIKHGECKSGWGPKPMMVNARRIDPGHPYYMEMRLRHTPPLPIGHVYIAYGHIDVAGEPIDEKLVMLSPIGGYAGAAVASAIPMPSLLTPHPDDCVIQPIAAYRVSLSAQQYEQLLLEIEHQKEKKPTYSLFAYNCNMFMSDVAKSVGILPPKNIYNPSLVYFYEMMDRNEGRKVPRTPGAEVEIAQARPLPQPVN